MAECMGAVLGPSDAPRCDLDLLLGFPLHDRIRPDWSLQRPRTPRRPSQVLQVVEVVGQSRPRLTLLRSRFAGYGFYGKTAISRSMACRCKPPTERRRLACRQAALRR